MAKKTNKQDTIVISKDKLLKGIGITVGVLLIIILCFVASSKNTENYSEKSTTEESSGEDILQLAIKQAGEVNEDERTAPNQITIDEYLNLYNLN